jgi:hypothetical protein
MTDEGWVADVYRPKAQKAALLRIADAIGARRKLGEDEAGNPRLEGKFGRVYVQPSTTEPGREPIFQLYLEGGAKRVKFAVAALSFAKVTNKGDEDMLVELKFSDVTPERGEIIRDKLGLRKRFVFDEAVLAKKREAAIKARAAVKNA